MKNATQKSLVDDLENIDIYLSSFTQYPTPKAAQSRAVRNDSHHINNKFVEVFMVCESLQYYYL